MQNAEVLCCNGTTAAQPSLPPVAAAEAQPASTAPADAVPIAQSFSSPCLPRTGMAFQAVLDAHGIASEKLWEVGGTLVTRYCQHHPAGQRAVVEKTWQHARVQRDGGHLQVR